MLGVAALSILEGCGVLVSCGLVHARGTGVSAAAVGPTVHRGVALSEPTATSAPATPSAALVPASAALLVLWLVLLLERLLVLLLLVLWLVLGGRWLVLGGGGLVLVLLWLVVVCWLQLWLLAHVCLKVCKSLSDLL